MYETLSKIGPMFSIAAAFGNVHGVYKPGNVTLQPERLGKHQAYAKEKLGVESDKPIFLVMHGGSGSTDDEIATAVKNGVVKMNIDTDTQWVRHAFALLSVVGVYCGDRRSVKLERTHPLILFSFLPQTHRPIGTVFVPLRPTSMTTSRDRLETPLVLISPTRNSTILVFGSVRRRNP